jgi:hypothetical protein
MWAEVFVRGAWVPVDATRADGHVGAGHVKLGDHSWHAAQSMTPLLPAMRVTVAEPTAAVDVAP